MGIFTITGQDTLTLFDRVLADLADGDVSTITFPNEIAMMKTGKNKNTIIAGNETGNNAELVLRVMRGSSDDRFLNNKLVGQQADLAAFVMANGQFSKRLGDGQGNFNFDIYNLAGGMFTKIPEGKNNVEGDTDQGVVTYNLKFSISNRVN